MKTERVLGETLLRLAMRFHPAEFRREYGNEMVEYYRTTMRTEGARRGQPWRVRFLVRSVGSAVRTGLAQRFGRRASGDAPKEPKANGGGIEMWWLDLRYAVRSLSRQRGFSAAVILVFALGMGANTAVFGVLNAVLLEPLPYPDSHQLVRMYQPYVTNPDEPGYATAPAFQDIREHARSFRGVTALNSYNDRGVDVTRGAGRPERVRALPVSAEYFDVLGVDLARGRGFERAHETGAARVAVLSAATADRLGQVTVGSTIILDGEATEVTGIAPYGFEDPVVGPVAVWLPLPLPTSDWPAWQWDNHYLTVLARLAPGVTLGSAQSDVEARFRVHQELEPAGKAQTGRLVPLHEDVVGNADSLLLLLMGAVGFLLLVACVNVAGLFLVRGAARGRELAVRVALGSPRSRLIRQLVSESTVLALAGAALGLLLGRALTRALTGMAPADLIPAAGVPFDAGVFGFSFGVAALVGVSFGLVPASVLTSKQLERSLRAGGRTGGQARTEGRMRAGLVVVQLALSLVLLVGAGLMIRSFDRLRQADLGFRAERVQTFQINLPNARYGDAGARVQFHAELYRRLSSLPGVRRVGAVSQLPATGSFLSWGVDPVPDPGDESGTQANQRVVEGDYFDVLRIPLVAGRVFGPEDGPVVEARVVISQRLAETMFPDGNAVGRQINVNGTRTVIGVVRDVAIGARGRIEPIVYHTHRQFGSNRNWAMTYVVAGDGNRSGLLDAVRHELTALDPDIVLFRPKYLRDVVGSGVASERFAMLMLASFGALALLLAAVGVYGVLAFSVNRQRQDIGVRMALGAQPSDVRGEVVRRGLTFVLIGTAIGAAGALALTQTLSTLVYGVRTHDPLTFGAATLVLCAVVLIASWLPARAATRVDPVIAFRPE